MKKLKILTLYGLLVIFFLCFGVSCSDTGTGGNNGEQTENTNDDNDQNDDDNQDDDSEESTVDEDIEHIELSIDNTLAALENLSDGKFSTTLETFVNANSGQFDAEWAGEMFANLEPFVNAQSIEENHRFDFEGHTGIYTWNKSSQDWSKTSTSGQIVLEFPSSRSSTTNDVTITLSNFEDTPVIIEGNGYYLPAQLAMSIEVDGTLIFGFDLNEIEYSDDELPIPGTLDLEIFTAPFTHHFSLNRNSGTEFEFGLDVENDGSLVTGLSLALTLAHSNYSDLNDDDFEMLSGTFNLTQDLAVNFSGELGTLASIEVPSENQINSLVSAEVLYQDIKIGDLEYSAEAENMIIIYKDGSSETVDRYYERFAEELELIFYTFTGEWADF